MSATKLDSAAIEAISTCEHCGEKLGLCQCDRDYTPLFEEFCNSLDDYYEGSDGQADR